MNLDQEKEQLAAIQQMRDMMERSSKFLSLSGLAGIVIGMVALLGVAMAYCILNMPISEINYIPYIPTTTDFIQTAPFKWLALDVIMVLVIALFTGSAFAIKNARKKALPIWDATSKRLMYNMFIPLVTGGLFIVALICQGQIHFVLSVMLVFYGLSLFNASKYAIDEIRILGMLEILLGLIAAFWVKGGLLIWAIGFGILHIIYGTAIYFKYEK